MPEQQQARLTQLVRNALAHLYDNAHLESHPLAALTGPGLAGPGLEHTPRAQQLRRALLECIESLRPQPRLSPDQAAGARAYAILTYRYVDDLSIDEICGRLAFSRRQFYREHEKGIRAVTALLSDRLPAQPSGAAAPEAPAGRDAPSGAGAQQSAAREEVARLRQAQALERIRIRHVVDETLALLDPVLKQTGRRLAWTADADPIVLADRIMLRQALLMVLNQLLREAQGDLQLTLSQADGAAQLSIGETALAVRAPGTPHDAPALVDDGIARALIEEQGGQFIVEWLAGRRQARLALPAANQPAVLVVDDNADLVALFQRYLGGHAVAVIGATSGETALRLAGEIRPQVITLDVMMPRQDGWDILQTLKRTPETRDIPVIVCSVLHEAQLAMSMGASGYIAKPVNQAEFLAVLGPWLSAPGSVG
jgi:CheY-like chemotaxis protein